MSILADPPTDAERRVNGFGLAVLQALALVLFVVIPVLAVYVLIAGLAIRVFS